jgi:hypothetical protein
MFEAFQALAQAYPHITILCAIAGAAVFATVTSRWL